MGRWRWGIGDASASAGASSAVASSAVTTRGLSLLSRSCDAEEDLVYGEEVLEGDRVSVALVQQAEVTDHLPRAGGGHIRVCLDQGSQQLVAGQPPVLVVVERRKPPPRVLAEALLVRERRRHRRYPAHDRLPRLGVGRECDADLDTAKAELDLLAGPRTGWDCARRESKARRENRRRDRVCPTNSVGLAAGRAALGAHGSC